MTVHVTYLPCKKQMFEMEKFSRIFVKTFEIITQKSDNFLSRQLQFQEREFFENLLPMT